MSVLGFCLFGCCTAATQEPGAAQPRKEVFKTCLRQREFNRKVRAEKVSGQEELIDGKRQRSTTNPFGESERGDRSVTWLCSAGAGTC